jgi:hypothetical protein
MVAAMAACVPSTFDNITGGQKPPDDKGDASVPTRGSPNPVLDPTLKVPRHVAPISVSWVNTLRPKLRWELTEPSLIGAVVELSRTRDFKELRSFIGTGTELVIPEDLAPGYWFWRLRGRTIASEGPSDGVVWEFLVRGGGPKGASDNVNGSIVDMNGDGEPDLVFTDEEKRSPTDTQTQYVQYILLGRSNHTFTTVWNDDTAIPWSMPTLDVSLAGGTDVDGDGFSDVLWADVAKPPGSETSEPIVALNYGGLPGYDDEKTLSIMGYVPTPSFTQVPALQTAGDVNGDGYGDFSVSSADLAFAALGSPKGSGAMLVLPLPSTSVKSTIPNALAGGCDLDGDGFSDIPIAFAAPSAPVAYVRGTSARVDALKTVSIGDIAAPPTATALTTGDFDGDGVADIAFSTVIKDHAGASFAAVCVYTPNAAPLNEDHCWKSTAPTEGFGVSLVAGDLDADGRDDIVVGSTSGIVVISMKSDGPGFDETPVAGKFVPQVTMIHPGRPDLARWAAIGTEGKTITIFKGKGTIHQVLDMTNDPYVVKLGSTIR